MKSSTELLRARLDELGVEYEKPTSGLTVGLTVAQIGSVQYRFYEHVGPYTNERDKGKVFVVTEWLTPEQAIAATVGKDIEHYDGSGRRGTVAILQGGRKPEEVLFVHDEGGVTHYLPEDAGTCKDLGGIGADDEVVFNCSECGCVLSVFDKDGNNNLCTDFIYDYPRFCPACGRKVIESKEEAE